MHTDRLIANATDAARRLSETTVSQAPREDLTPLVRRLHKVVEDLGGPPAPAPRSSGAGA